MPYIYTCPVSGWRREHHTTRKSFLTWGYDIEEVLELVHPDLGQPPVVLVDDVAGAPGEGVRRGLAEHVSHVRAGDDLQGAAALPDLEPKHAENGEPNNEGTHRALSSARGVASRSLLIYFPRPQSKQGILRERAGARLLVAVETL